MKFFNLSGVDFHVDVGDRRIWRRSTILLACSLVGFSQGLSASQQCFPLTTNQHQPGLSVQKPSSEQTDWLLSFTRRACQTRSICTADSYSIFSIQINGFSMYDLCLIFEFDLLLHISFCSVLYVHCDIGYFILAIYYNYKIAITTGLSILVISLPVYGYDW